MLAKLEQEVKEILDWEIKVTNAQYKVPTKEDLTLGETAKLVETCILFVDIRGSSVITDTHRKTTTVKMLNAFLNGVVRIAKSNFGHVRSFNGDSLLIIFDPDMNEVVCDKAVDTALKIKGFIETVLLSAIKRKRYEEDFKVGIGITKDKILVSKAGIRGADNNDLLWTCTGTNLAAKMGNDGSDIIVSEKVYNELSDCGLYSQDVNDNYISKHMWYGSTFQFANSQLNVYKTNWFRFL